MTWAAVCSSNEVEVAVVVDIGQECRRGSGGEIVSDVGGWEAVCGGLEDPVAVNIAGVDGMGETGQSCGFGLDLSVAAVGAGDQDIRFAWERRGVIAVGGEEDSFDAVIVEILEHKFAGMDGAWKGTGAMVKPFSYCQRISAVVALTGKGG